MIEINKIYNEDCMDTMFKMNDNFVDIIITSPPYNIGVGRKNGKRSKSLSYDNYNDNLDKKSYFKKIKKWLDEMIRVTKYHIFFNIQEIRGNKGIIKFLYKNYQDNIKEVLFGQNKIHHLVLMILVYQKVMNIYFVFQKTNLKKLFLNTVILVIIMVIM